MFIPTSHGVVAGRYELLEEIARGGMGVIWRARQTDQQGEVAIKFIHADCARDPEVRRRFLREAQAAASLRGPNSVAVLAVDEWQGCPFIAMELLRGESLEARLGREGRLPHEVTLQILDQVARGLLKAHSARLVHRDLKPENIFLVGDDPLLVKLLDFGIAKHLDAITGAQTATGALVGTPWYMSPEQALGEKGIDSRSDLWSLGVVAFRCLTGELPFHGDGLGRVLLEIMHGTIPAPRAFNASLPPSVDEWWFRTMQRDPAGRPPSVTALVNELREALMPQDEWPESAPVHSESAPVRSESVPRFHDSMDEFLETLPPVAASRRLSAPVLVRYSVASVPALVFAGWLVGSRLWPVSSGSQAPGFGASSLPAAPAPAEPVVAEPVSAEPVPVAPPLPARPAVSPPQAPPLAAPAPAPIEAAPVPASPTPARANEPQPPSQTSPAPPPPPVPTKSLPREKRRRTKPLKP
jgi:eukaryotic-like serine/threonine-protein kinase